MGVLSFVRFIGRLVLTQTFAVIVGAILMALGFTKQWLLTLVASPPWYLTHWLLAPSLVALGLLPILWAAYAQSQLEVAIPDRLRATVPIFQLRLDWMAEEARPKLTR